jgi:hypothetical protein
MSEDTQFLSRRAKQSRDASTAIVMQFCCQPDGELESGSRLHLDGSRCRDHHTIVLTLAANDQTNDASSALRASQ